MSELEDAEGEDSTTSTAAGGFDHSGGSSGSSSSSSSGTDPWTSAGSSTSDWGGFIMAPDIPPGEAPCDTFTQDCPEGQKCIFHYDQNWGEFTRICVDVHPQAHGVGESCQMWGDGDDCAHGTQCWDPDPVTQIGMCVELCGNSPDAPVCETPGTFCAFGKSIQVCLQQCDPREDEACPVGCGCYPANSEFMCLLDGSGDLGAHGDPCEYANGCDPGRICIGSAAIPGCDSEVGCCTTPCDISAPACPDPALVCVPWYEEGNAPAGFETLGVCILPE